MKYSQQNAYADGLSRLQCKSGNEYEITDVLSLQQIETFTVAVAQIQKETRRDITLSKVLEIRHTVGKRNLQDLSHIKIGETN